MSASNFTLYWNSCHFSSRKLEIWKIWTSKIFIIKKRYFFHKLSQKNLVKDVKNAAFFSKSCVTLKRLNTRSSIKFEKFPLKIECFSTKFIIKVPQKQLKLKNFKKMKHYNKTADILVAEQHRSWQSPI